MPRKTECGGLSYALTCAGHDSDRFCSGHVMPSSNQKLSSFATNLSQERLTGCLRDHVDHEIWFRVHRAVIDTLRIHMRVHAFGHEMLRLGIDHAVLFGN